MTSLPNYTVSIETMDATPATITSFSIPKSSPHTSVFVQARLLAITMEGTESGYANTLASAFYNGKAIISPGGVPSINFITTPVFMIKAYWQISDLGLELVVEGINGKPIKWVCEYSFIETSVTSGDETQDASS